MREERGRGTFLVSSFETRGLMEKAIISEVNRRIRMSYILETKKSARITTKSQKMEVTEMSIVTRLFLCIF